MRYALIGCGRISVNHIQAALNNNLEIVGLCDLIPERVNEKKEKFPLVKDVPLYTDYVKMLEEVKPTLVAIATESGEHAKIAKECIRHKVNVIIEKPISLALSDAREIINLANERNITLHRLSLEAGIPYSTLSSFINKKSQSPKLATLLHICEGLGIELNDFFTDKLFKDVEED